MTTQGHCAPHSPEDPSAQPSLHRPSQSPSHHFFPPLSLYAPPPPASHPHPPHILPSQAGCRGGRGEPGREEERRLIVIEHTMPSTGTQNRSGDPTSIPGAWSLPRWMNRGSERLCGLPKDTQLCKPDTRAQISLRTKARILALHSCTCIRRVEDQSPKRRAPGLGVQRRGPRHLHPPSCALQPPPPKQLPE